LGNSGAAGLFAFYNRNRCWIRIAASPPPPSARSANYRRDDPVADGFHFHCAASGSWERGRLLLNCIDPSSGRNDPFSVDPAWIPVIRQRYAPQPPSTRYAPLFIDAIVPTARSAVERIDRSQGMNRRSNGGTNRNKGESECGCSPTRRHELDFPSVAHDATCLFALT